MDFLQGERTKNCLEEKRNLECLNFFEKKVARCKLLSKSNVLYIVEKLSKHKY
jgi:hypothetical protein